ncbi:MAG: phage head closure protein [Bacillota bacterium]
MVIKIGDLNRRIEVLSQRDSKDSFGGAVGEWITVGLVWAKIQPNQASETIDDDQVKTKQMANITMRFYAGLTSKHRIKYKEKIYNIQSVSDVETSHRWTIAVVEEIESGKL